MEVDKSDLKCIVSQDKVFVITSTKGRCVNAIVRRSAGWMSKVIVWWCWVPHKDMIRRWIPFHGIARVLITMFGASILLSFVYRYNLLVVHLKVSTRKIRKNPNSIAVNRNSRCTHVSPPLNTSGYVYARAYAVVLA